MAFDFNFLSNTGGTSAGPIIYTYFTEDDRSVVLAADYFNSLYTKIRVKDLIIVVNTSDVYTVKIISVVGRAVVVEKTNLSQREHAEYHLTTTAEVINVNDDGVTYSKINNMVLNIGSPEFTVTNGTLNHVGVGGRFLINGTSDLEVNKAADVTYALTINDVNIPTELTTVSFSSSAKKRNISITAITNLSSNDTIEIHVKGDGTATLIVTVNKLDITFLEI